MEIKGICWMGVGTDSFDKTVAFFTDVLGLKVLLTEQPVAMLQAGPNQILEIFGEGSTRGKTLNTPPTIAFEVDDVTQAAKELAVGGAQLIGEMGAWNGHAWQYFRTPDGHLFEIKSSPAAPQA